MNVGLAFGLCFSKYPTLSTVFYVYGIKHGMNKPQMKPKLVSHTWLSMPEHISRATSGSLLSSSQGPLTGITFSTFRHEKPIYIYIGV